MILFGTNQLSAAKQDEPSKTFNAFLEAIQIKDIDRAFELDYDQQKKLYGKFEYEKAEQKKEYAKSFEGNPSICPNRINPIKGVPCTGTDKRNKVTELRLFIPEGAKFKILETVLYGQNKSKCRILLRVEYTKSNNPILIENLKSIDVHDHLQIPPVPPAFIPRTGIITPNNIFFSSKLAGNGKLKYPISFEKKAFKQVFIEVGAVKINDYWMIDYTKLIKEKTIFSEQKVLTTPQKRIPQLVEYLKDNPSDVEKIVELGNLYYDNNMFSSAIVAYEKSLKLSPNNYNVLTDLGVMHRRNGDSMRALKCFNEAIAINPKAEIAYYNKGVVLYHDFQDKNGCIAVWEKLLEINPMASAPNGTLLKNLVEEYKTKP
jgi:tetratricopeptide (TPR) repeat protein